MRELSIYAKIKQALELAKAAGVGCTFNQFETVELLGYIKSMEEYTADLRSELAALEHAIYDMKEAQCWIPVKARMPEKNIKVICYCPSYDSIEMRVGKDVGAAVSHWYEPQPPEEE